MGKDRAHARISQNMNQGYEKGSRGSRYGKYFFVIDEQI